MRNGFSLVELSVVLVILGLMTGAILAGRSLIRASELRSVIADVERYQIAYHSFRDKYKAPPGDMPNATRFWGSAGGTGADQACYMAQTAISPATCDGDGNGLVQSGGMAYGERFAAWKHLANAALIEGNYTGKTAGAAGTYDAVIDSNVPASKITNSFYDIFALSASSNYFTTAFVGQSIHFFGRQITPQETFTIDKKMDDGSPAYGTIVVPIRSYIPCPTGDTPDATYDLASDSKTCVFHSSIN